MHELLQEETTYEIGKELNKQMREIAADLDLTWGEMPGFVKKGAWYGGSISPKGGRTAEAKREMTLPFDRRAKGFFKQLAKFLAQKHAEGHIISAIANTAQNGKPTPMTPEQLQAEFDKVTVGALEQAKCRWYISFSEEQTASASFLRLEPRVTGYNFTTLYTDMAFSAHPDQLKKAKRQLKDLAESLPLTSKLVHDLLVIWKEAGGVPKPAESPEKGMYRRLEWSDYLTKAQNPVAKGLHFKPTAREDYEKQRQLQANNAWGKVLVKGGVMSKVTVKVPAEPVLAAINSWWEKL